MKKTAIVSTIVAALSLLSAAAACAAERQYGGGSVLAATDPIVGVKQTTKGKPNVLAESGDFDGDRGDEEQPPAAIDGDTFTKYFNQAHDGSNPIGVNSGLVVTRKAGPVVVTAIQFAAANDLPGRDPLKITLEGSNDPKARQGGFDNFQLLYEGDCGLDSDPGRNNWANVILFANTTAYASYRVLVTAKRRGYDADAVQFAEVSLLARPADGQAAGTSTAGGMVNINDSRANP